MTLPEPLDYNLMRDLIHRGLTANRIAFLLHVTRPTVANTCLKKWPSLYLKLMENGRASHGRGNMKISSATVLQEFSSGLSRHEIAAKYGVCWQAVHNHLVRHGAIEPNTRSKKYRIGKRNKDL